jgi:hypothetical protein
VSLYKYVTPDRLDVLRSLRIRFTQPTAQNDPFEFSPVVRGFIDPARTAAVLSEEYDRQFPEALGKYAAPLGLSVPQFMSRLKPTLVAMSAKLADQASPFLFEKLFDTLGKTLGILSLSETPSSLPMWAHYAANHTGFVLEFDEGHSWFWMKRSDTDEFRHLRKVTYADMSPPRYLGDLEGQEVFYSKLKEWEYEKEWRIIRPLEESSAHFGEIYLFDVPPACIKGVVMGSRRSDSSAADLRAVLTANPALRHVHVSQAVLSKSTNSIEIGPIR